MTFFKNSSATFFIGLTFSILISSHSIGQGRNINKLTLETTYSNTEIHPSLRDLVDKHKREDYFNDDFFNAMLIKILSDNQFTSKEKVQLFYLMQKKLGYAFVGVNYLPPKQNYFIFHLSKVQVLKTTQEALSKQRINGSVYIQIADSHRTNDPVIASNALLLASLLKAPGINQKLRQVSTGKTIMQSKNPTIFNHYVGLSASVTPDTAVTTNLKNSLKTFTQEGMLEDVLCAMYSNPCPFSPIKSYIQAEKNPENDLAIQTALCILNYKVPEGAYNATIKSVLDEKPEPWKAELLKKIQTGKIPFNYTLTRDHLSPKTWGYVKISIYNDGTLISNNTLLEFDPN